MKTKEKYLEQAEIKVKNLFSELYESESEIQKEILTTKEKLSRKINELETQYKEVSKKRKELDEKFNQLIKTGDVQWENAQKDFDLLLKYIEGDRDTFIQKAELVINDLGAKIKEIEDKAVDAASDIKDDLTKKADELKVSKEELQEKINSIKNDSGDRWRDIKHWFIEKSESVKKYMSSNKHS